MFYYLWLIELINWLVENMVFVNVGGRCELWCFFMKSKLYFFFFSLFGYMRWILKELILSIIDFCCLMNYFKLYFLNGFIVIGYYVLWNVVKVFFFMIWVCFIIYFCFDNSFVILLLRGWSWRLGSLFFDCFFGFDWFLVDEVICSYI